MFNQSPDIKKSMFFDYCYHIRIVLIFKLIQYTITLPKCIFCFLKEIYFHRLKKN